MDDVTGHIYKICYDKRSNSKIASVRLARFQSPVSVVSVVSEN
jgi:hypothetical protein